MMSRGSALTPAGSPVGHREGWPGKRVFDVVVATACLMILLPLLVAVWAVVRMTTPGKALFRQVRVGLNGRPFALYKFRTMYDACPDETHRQYVWELLNCDAPRAGGAKGVYKLHADPRVTRVGRLLRRTSIDELPQLVNVIRGDMSLVGPRPSLPWEAQMLDEAHQQRFLVPPGITGLWQVSGRNTLTMRQALDLDVEYVQKQCFVLDLVILLKTVPMVLSMTGAG